MVLAHSVLMSNLRLSAICFGIQVRSAPVSNRTCIFLLLILGSLNLEMVHSVLGDDVAEHTSPFNVGMDEMSFAVFGSTLYTSLLCSALS